MVDIDVVIPTFGRPSYVTTLLYMLLEQHELPLKVIVVNQTPSVKRPEHAVVSAYQTAGVDLIWINRAIPSLCGARNDALKVASSKVCLFLDDDIIVPPDLVKKHWAKYLDSDLAAVGGQVFHRQAEYPVESISLEKPRGGTFPAMETAEILESGPLFGGHFSVRREVAIAIDGWDEAFIGSANWEEGDLIHRLRAHGYRFVWDPDPWLIHIRLPMGGCRIPGNKSFTEWSKTANFFLYKYRYPHDKTWMMVLKATLRAGPLRKENMKNPFRWPIAWISFFRGWWEGYRRASTPYRLSQININRN